MTQSAADDQGMKAEAKRQLEEARDFAKTLTPEEARGGQWFLKLLAHVTKVYDRNARAVYFQRKYPGLPADDIADTLISVAARYAGIIGGATGAASTASIITATMTAGATMALFVGSIGAEMLSVAAIQMRLVLDMATVYDLDLDPEDPEDVLMVFGYAFCIAPADAIGTGLARAAGAATKYSVKKYVSKGTLVAVKKFGQRLGVKILQKTIIKYAVPVASAAIGSTYNYVTTKSLGEIAKRHLRNRGKMTEESRALVSRRNAYDLAFPAAVLHMAKVDGGWTAEERDLYKAMLSRMSFDDHSADEFNKLSGDRDSVLEAISQIVDRDVLEALVELLTLMAICDGAVVPEERDWLLCVAESAQVPIDMEQVEARAREFQIVVKDALASKASELASDSAKLAKDKLKLMFSRPRPGGGDASPSEQPGRID